MLDTVPYYGVYTVDMRTELFLLPYVLLFTAVAILWRVYRVWRLSGVNALTNTPASGIPQVVSRYFRVTFALAVIVAMLGFLPAAHRQFLAPFQSLEHSIIDGSGWVVLCAVFVLVVVAQVQMGEAWRISVDPDQQRKLVTDGIFRWSRNPIFVGMRGWYLGIFLVMPNAFTLLLWVLGDLLIQLQVRLEEAYLIDTFGDEYRTYMMAVRRWL